MENEQSLIQEALEESAAVKTETARTLAGLIAQAGRLLVTAFRAGNKLFIAGNGGSAADAQHIATELVVRFMKQRDALPAIALTTDTSILTAAGNDTGFDTVFSRQIEALAKEGDVFLALTTSGTSPNIVRAIDAARARGVSVIAMTGRNGTALRDKADLLLAVPSMVTPRIQETHITIAHILCDLIERELFDTAD